MVPAPVPCDFPSAAPVAQGVGHLTPGQGGHVHAVGRQVIALERRHDRRGGRMSPGRGERAEVRDQVGAQVPADELVDDPLPAGVGVPGGRSKTLANTGTLVFTGSVTSSTTAPDGTCGTGTCTAPTNTTTYPVGITTAASSPTPVKIFDTSANTGMGTILVGYNNPTGWWLNVPANAYAGTYTSTITWQLTSAP